MIGQTFAHYQILAKLGQGGMGEVFEALDTRLGRRVALKLLPASLRSDPGAQTRLQREARAAATLDHPFICKIYETAEHDGQHYIAMEFVEGRTLLSRLPEGPLPLAELLQVATELAEALEVAHEHGITHRDLKPANIMLGRGGHIKVMDFGLAKQTGSPFGTADRETLIAPLTTPGTIVGTIDYMSPEQLRGREVDARSDIFSFGTVLYECLTGRHPFRRESGADTAGAILSNATILLDLPGIAVPPLLADILRRTLARDAGARYQTAAELVRDLRQVRPEASSGPMPAAAAPAGTVAAAPASAAPKTRWWPSSRLGRWIAVLGAAALLVLAAIATFLMVSPKPVLSFTARDWILIADFENQTGDPLFDRSLNMALSISLEQSRHANVFPRGRTAEALRRMGKQAGQKLDEPIGRELCIREKIRGLVVPSISKVGQQYSLGLRIIDPQKGDTVRSYLEGASGQNQILPKLEELAKALRHDLGESLGAIQMSNRELSRVTTHSLEALKLFSDGVALWSHGRYKEATQQQEAALKLDQDFATAHNALGIYYSSFVYNNRTRAREHFEKSVSLVDRVTERERQSIQIAYEAFQGNTQAALNLSRVYLQSYPDDLAMRYNYAGTLRDEDRTEEAISEYRQILSINPNHANSWINLATCLVHRQNCAESLKAYGNAFALEPAWLAGGNINHEYGFRLVECGKPAEAREAFAKALDGQSRSQALRSMALLDMYQGKYASARKNLEDALLMNVASKAALSEARNHGFMAILFEGQGKAAARVAELDKALKVLEGIPPVILLAARVGVGYARAGAIQKAIQTLEKIRGQAETGVAEQEASVSRLEGEIELAKGNVTKALESLTAAHRRKQSAYTIESLARAYEASGDTARALSHYENALLAENTVLGNESQQDGLAAHYHLAKLYQAQGQKDKARQLIGKLLEIWKDADSDLPLLREAQKLRSELHAD